MTLLFSGFGGPIDHKTELAAFAHALANSADESEALEAHRTALLEAAGPDAVFDAVCFAAFFAAITRMVDATGNQLGFPMRVMERVAKLGAGIRSSVGLKAVAAAGLVGLLAGVAVPVIRVVRHTMR